MCRLFNGPFCGGWVVKSSPLWKLVKIMLENINLVRKCTHIWSFRKYIFFWEGCFTFHDDNIFCKRSGFFRMSNTFTQSDSVRAVLEFLVLISVLIIWKANVYGNISFTDHESGFRLPGCSKVDLKWENDNDRRICQYDEFVKSLLTLLWFPCQVSFLTFISVSSLLLELWKFSFTRDYENSQV